jgi:hypothetical protein
LVAKRKCCQSAVLLAERLEAALQPERGPVDREHLGVVQEAVEDGCGEHLVAEGLGSATALASAGRLLDKRLHHHVD